MNERKEERKKERKEERKNERKEERKEGRKKGREKENTFKFTTFQQRRKINTKKSESQKCSLPSH